MSDRSLVIGDGGWGQALAMSLLRAGRAVTVWGHDADYAEEVARTRVNRKFLPDVPVPEEIRWTGDLDAAREDAAEAWSVVPTQFLRATVARFGARLDGLPLVSASKGLERRGLARPSEVLREVVGDAAPLCVLSGPSHAEETARGGATSVVAAADDPALARRVQERIGHDALRVYVSDDVPGVELGGALKNIIAVAAGIADAIGLGDNGKAALVSRGLVEMARFGTALGARSETFFGLSGAGDLIVTCYSGHSRNRALGEQIGRGSTLERILEGSEKVAEGVWTCQAIHDAAGRVGVEMPITEALYAVLFEGAAPQDAVRALMRRPAQTEFEDLPRAGGRA